MAESPTSSTYPGVIDSWNFLTDKEDLAEVSDINKIKNALLATQTEMGAAPSGTLADITTRLGVMTETNGVLKKGTSFPASPSEGQMFYRTDLDTTYIYDGSTWDLLSTPAMTVSSVTTWTVDQTTVISLSANKVYLLNFRATIDGTTDAAFKIDFGTGATHDYSISGYELTTGAIGSAAVGAASIPFPSADAAVGTKICCGSFYIFTTPVTDQQVASMIGTVCYYGAAGAKPAIISVSAFIFDSGGLAGFTIECAQQSSGAAYLYEMGLTA